MSPVELDYEAAQGEASSRYDLDREQVHGLCQEFLDAQEKDQTSQYQFGCYIVGAENSYSNLGRYVEASVFYETFGNEPGLMENEYGPYESVSEFYVVIDHEAQMPVGAMRIIKNSSAGLKSLEDLKDLPLGFDRDDVLNAYDINPDRCVDIATLAVLEDYRGEKTGYLPSLLTYRTLFLQVLNNPDYDYVVTIIDEKAERNLKTLKFPFVPMLDSGYFSYLDSPKSHALLAKTTDFTPKLSEWVEKLRRDASNSDIKKWLARTIDSLINPSKMDEMLAQNVPRRIKE